MDSEIDLKKFGFTAGERVLLIDDDWSLVGSDSDVILVDIEPVPGSSQCVIRAGDQTRTVSRSNLRSI